MLIFMVKLIVSPIAVLTDACMVLMAFLLWDERFLTTDSGILIIEKVWTKKN